MHVFTFEAAEPNKDIVGGKGASLAVMTQLGLPIPPGFTISTTTCIEYLANDNKYSDGVWDEVLSSMSYMEDKMGLKFNDPKNPLLVSIRSGARISMPGMMDTVLNCGLNDEIVDAFGKATNNPRFVKDAYRRLIQMFADVVCELDMEKFHSHLENLRTKVGVENDFELTEENLDELIANYKSTFEELNGSAFPQEPLVQLDMAIQAVFKSWNNQRAINYRNFEKIPHDIGTAVNVQAMVYGNYDNSSGTGVLFTRNPSTGENKVFGEYLINAQGEDVVAGIRTPQNMDEMKNIWPENYQELMDHISNVEKHFKDMQDIEFTIERQKLYILQTRSGKRTGPAAAKIAVDMVNEGLITKEDAIMRISARDIEEAIFPRILWKNIKSRTYYDVENITQQLEKKSLKDIIDTVEAKVAIPVGKGLPAGPGAASGHAVFSSDVAERIVATGEAPFEITKYVKRGDKMIPRLILVKNETSPEDFHGMVASQGILTMTGGMTSHAALVGRQIGKRVIVGAGASGLDLRGNLLRSKDGSLMKEGDIISIEIIDEGLIFANYMPIITPDELPKELETILDWSDAVAKMKVRANADKENDTQMAVDNKSTGTGLARTEHQFFDALDIMRDMILADTDDERNEALDKMEILQREDFEKLFTVSDGRPVTIRLLDPPLHEFLPSEIEIRQEIYDNILDPDATLKNSVILRKVLYYQESNPMLGLRGVRLGLMIPKIITMQTSAILEAALKVGEKGKPIVPEIMIPLIGTNAEFRAARKLVDETAEKIFEKHGKRVDYLVGTMIEIPRAALTADEIAAGEFGADFFSFGTNDLHQMTLGFSRDDVGKFLPFYLENDLLPVDPFQTIDEHGTGKLMQMSVEYGRKAAAEAGKYLSCGICGEQGGDPESIDFCYRIGLDYVSCSPFRIPVARLSVAQATLRNPEPDAKYGKDLSYQKKLELKR